MPPAFRPLLGSLCTTDVDRALTLMLEPEPPWMRPSWCLSVVSIQIQISLCLARARHRQSIWQEVSSSCLHFLHMAFSERPIICRCHLSVQWPVNSPVTSQHFFLSHCALRQFIHRPFNEELQLPHTWFWVPLLQPLHPQWAYRH